MSGVATLWEVVKEGPKAPPQSGAPVSSGGSIRVLAAAHSGERAGLLVAAGSDPMPSPEQ